MHTSAHIQSTFSPSGIPNDPESDTLLNLKQVAKKLGDVSVRSVRRLIAKGLLPQPVKVLSVPTIPDSEVSACIEKLKRERNQKGKI